VRAHAPMLAFTSCETSIGVASLLSCHATGLHAADSDEGRSLTNRPRLVWSPVPGSVSVPVPVARHVRCLPSRDHQTDSQTDRQTDRQKRAGCTYRVHGVECGEEGACAMLACWGHVLPSMPMLMPACTGGQACRRSSERTTALMQPVDGRGGPRKG
jgi:hypothetical protein